MIKICMSVLASLLASIVLGLADFGAHAADSATSLKLEERLDLQSVFSAKYTSLLDRAARLEDFFEKTKNEILVNKEQSLLREEERQLRIPRPVRDWDCEIDEVLQSSASYDARLRTRGGHDYHLVICQHEKLRYLVLCKRPVCSAELATRNKDGSSKDRLKFSGAFGVFPQVARFHSNLLPPTFIVHATFVLLR